MTNITVRPFRNALACDIDRAFGDIFRFPAAALDPEAEFTPRVNIKETAENIVLSFELPGMEKSDIKVLVKDGTLIVSGERAFKSEEKEENIIRTEIRTGKFSRSFTLPETVDPEQVSADYKNGILEIKLAKHEEVKPKEIEVKVS
jgi:HSP20 family protein